MPNVTETQTGIFEFSCPLTISTEKWINEHLDCDAIIDNLGSTIVVYAFTREPQYNYALERYKKKEKLSETTYFKGDIIRWT